MQWKLITDLEKIRSIADYQFGKDVGNSLFPNNVRVVTSKTTGRIRYVYLNEKRLVTLRPTDGLFSLSIAGARRIIKNQRRPRLWVKVKEEAAPFIKKGRSVFAKHIVDADIEIRPMEEVIVINRNQEVLAVGRAALTGEEMKAFKNGVAVKVRKGASKEK